MKTLLKLSIANLCLFCSAGLSAQDYVSDMRKAEAMLKKDSANTELKWQAWGIVAAYANQDSTEAMNAMGVFYEKGIKALNIRPDYDMCRYWYEKAAEKGHPGANYSLAMMYYYSKYGIEQNLDLAFQYAKKSVESGNPLFMFGLEIFYERGYGCEQSYEKALECAKYAAGKNHRGAAYNLGLYYRNGYGVERDTAVANYWFEKAKQLGHPFPEVEMAGDPERPLEVIQMDKVPETVAAKQRKSTAREQVKHTLRKSENIEGTYTGAIITYDWSGKYPLRENFLEVTFSQSDSGLVVKWIEEDATELVALVTLTDSALLFHNATYIQNNLEDHARGSRKEFKEWDLVKATLNYMNEGGQVILSGNLHLRYHNFAKEPGRPTYLILQREQPETDKTDTLTLNDPTIDVEPETENPVFVSHVLAYPNPFTDYLNVSFSLEQKGNCEMQIYSTSGVLIFQQKLGMLEQGTHRYQLNTSGYANGSYVLKLVCGSQVWSQVLVR